jgi:hypothetical protein
MKPSRKSFVIIQDTELPAEWEMPNAPEGIFHHGDTEARRRKK